jgi:hypothetical protein
MKNGRKALSRCALASLQVLLLYGLLWSSPPEKPNVKPTIEVTAVASREFNELENSVMRLFKQALLKKGFGTSDRPDVELFVAVSRIPDGGDLLALSVVTVTTPPEKLVEFAKKNELFYRASEWDAEKLPEEGRAVRQVVSEDYMRQFGWVQDHRIFFINGSRLQEEIENTVDRLQLNRIFLR